MTRSKKTILVICPYPQGYAASQRLKYEQYFELWEDTGYEITVSSFFNFDTWKILYEDGFFFRKVLGTLRGYIIRFLDLFRLASLIMFMFACGSPPFRFNF